MRVCLLYRSCGSPRHLHPFPTRRSSDLETEGHRGQGDVLRRGTGIQERQHLPTLESHGDLGPLEVGADQDDRRGIGQKRSEEHTSELQSLRHLVCRLLLEKKKQKKKHTN